MFPSRSSTDEARTKTRLRCKTKAEGLEPLAPVALIRHFASMSPWQMVGSPQNPMTVATRWTFLYVLAVLVLTSDFFAQDATPLATVRVVVRDSNMKLASGARVTGGLGREARTDASGTVTYSGVGIGRKNIFVYHPGAKIGIALPRSSRADLSRSKSNWNRKSIAPAMTTSYRQQPLFSHATMSS
jgi:hypothetical protein